MSDCRDIAVLPRSESLRRLDVFTPITKRRTFTPEEKARLVAESFASGDSVCAVARRHRISASQLFAWRKNARRGGEISPHGGATIVDRADIAGRTCPRGEPTAHIEIAIGSAVVRVPHGIDRATLKLVLDALREA